MGTASVASYGAELVRLPFADRATGARWAMAVMGAAGVAAMIVILLAQPRARHIR